MTALAACVVVVSDALAALALGAPAAATDEAVEDEDDAAAPTLLLDRSIDFSMLLAAVAAAVAVAAGAAVVPLKPEEACNERMMTTNPSKPNTILYHDFNDKNTPSILLGFISRSGYPSCEDAVPLAGTFWWWRT